MSDDVDLVRAIRTFYDDPTEATWQQFLPYVTKTSVVRAAPAPPRLFDYWGPRGFLLDSPAAPLDYYRLVDNDDEVQAALAAGEKPLHGHRGMTPAELARQQLLQWEGPNRLFAVDRAGHGVELLDPAESDDPAELDDVKSQADRPFIPVWQGEGYPTPSLHDRLQLENYLRRMAPDLLNTVPAAPSDLQSPPRLESRGPGVDLANVLAQAFSRSVRPMLVAQGPPAESGSAMRDDALMRWRQGIPSFREEQIGTPEFPRPEPMPRIIPWESGPTTPPDMPLLPPPVPLDFMRPSPERVNLGSPIRLAGIG